MGKKKEPKYIKQYFSERPPNTGYHAKRVHEVPEELAKEYQKQGYCRDATQTLPDDMPGAEEFMEAGIESVDEVKALEDPTEVKGIGDATAKDLAEWFQSKEE